MFIQFSTLINPSYISSQSVGCCFKGLQTFDTAVLEFKFQNSFVTFNFEIHPTFCLKKGCILCLKKDAFLYITKICILYFFSFCSTEGAFLWKKSRLYSLVSLTIGWLTFKVSSRAVSSSLYSLRSWDSERFLHSGISTELFSSQGSWDLDSELFKQSKKNLVKLGKRVLSAWLLLRRSSACWPGLWFFTF